MKHTYKVVTNDGITIHEGHNGRQASRVAAEAARQGWVGGRTRLLMDGNTLLVWVRGQNRVRRLLGQGVA